jgi:CRP/FNR family transcriptional regulator
LPELIELHPVNSVSVPPDQSADDEASLREQLARFYPALLADPPAGGMVDLLRPGAVIAVGEADLLFHEGSPCAGFPLLIEGEVRVARGEPQGRAIELYRVVPGEVCLVSASCLLGGEPLSAHGVAVRDSRLLLLPAPLFMRWSAQEPFRRWVFSVFAQRMGDLIALAEAVAFQRLDQRLAAALLGRGGQLAITHQRLADELGTVREMVTRLLKRFEQSGWVSLGRERILVIDAAALRRVAAGAAAQGG